MQPSPNVIHHTSIPYVLFELTKTAQSIRIPTDCSRIELTTHRNRISDIAININELWEAASQLKRLPETVVDHMPALENLADNAYRASLVVQEADAVLCNRIAVKFTHQCEAVQRFFPIPKSDMGNELLWSSSF